MHNVLIAERDGTWIVTCLHCGWQLRSVFGPQLARAAEWHSLTGETVAAA